MSVTYASTKNVASKVDPNPLMPYVNQSSVNDWVRPADWLTLTAPITTDEKLVGLVAVTDDSTNFIALSCTLTGGAATYDVDWGDGTSSTSVATNAIAQHAYDYASISSGTLSSRGYKQVIITVTPTVGATLTGINLNRVYTPVSPQIALPTNAVYKWLDIALASQSLNNLTFLSNSPAVAFPYLEQVNIVSSTTTGNASFYVNLFSYLKALKSVVSTGNISNYNSLSGVFSDCGELKYAPDFPATSAASVSLYAAFNNCFSLEYVPNYSFAVGGSNSFFSTFNNCYNLRKAPMLNLALVDNAANAFSACGSLIDVPVYNLGNAIDFTSMFNGCVSLVTAPFMITNSAILFNTMFAACRSLINVPTYNTANVTGMANMFQNCSSLKTIPLFNTSSVTDTSIMFSGCQSLSTIPLLDTSNVVSMSSMFATCVALETIPLLNTSNVTNMTSMFNGCTSLLEIPLLDTSKVTQASTMFNTCRSLVTIPLLNTSNITNMTGMFSSTNNLESLPNIDTSNCTTFTSMFNASGLITAPDIDTGKSSVFTSMFLNCPRLTTVPDYNTGNAITMTTMFSTCPSLNKIPILDMSKVTSTPGVFASGVGISRFRAYGCKYSMNLSNCYMGKIELEELFLNLGVAPSAQTITITNNNGASTALAKTATWNGTSTTLTVTSGTGITTGMWIYGTNINSTIACTFTDASDTVLISGKVLSNGTPISFATIVSTTGISVYNLYYIVNSGGGGTGYHQLALTPGGAPISLTTNGSGTCQWGTQITNVVGTTLTLSAYPSGSGTGAAITVRDLNTHLATLKRWTVSG